MAINESLGINSAVSPLGKAYLKAEETARPKTSLPNDKIPQSSVNQDSVAISMNGSTQKMFSSVQGTNTEMNLVAKSVRETNSAQETIGGHLNGMKAALSTIVKNFPPFPHDSAERAKVLMSYMSLRKEIEKMTIPASFTAVLDALPDLSVSATDSQVDDALKTVESVKMQFDNTKN